MNTLEVNGKRLPPYTTWKNLLGSFVLRSQGTGLTLSIGTGSEGDMVVSRDFRAVYLIGKNGNRRRVRDKKQRQDAVAVVQKALVKHDNDRQV